MPANNAQIPDAFSLPMIANSQKFALASARLQAQAFKTMMRYQIEMLSFLKHRCEQDMKLAEDLAESDQLNDAFDVFSNFLQNAMTDYSMEASKVAEIGSKVASETARRVRKEGETVIENFAATTTAA